MLKRLFTTLIGLILGFAILGAGIVAIAVLVTYPRLPKLDIVTNYKPKMPLEIYTSDGKLIGLYGEERRSFTKIQDFPDNLKNAVMAAEDKRFYEHWGVDVVGISRAMVGNMVSGGVRSGASTITQQVAKNFFLTNERTFTRKFNEALLAYKIEQQLSKDEILELYFNQIYLGQRAYGFAAAAHTYFGKPVSQLTLGEATMLAGLPKAPSAFNPIVNPKRAQQRQAYILNNMQELGMITEAERQAALSEQLKYTKFQSGIDQNALYVAEMARQSMVDKYGEEAYTNGFKVYTTVNSVNQTAATKAFRQGMLNFDKSQRYRGAEDFIDLKKLDSKNLYIELDEILDGHYDLEGMRPAVVLKATGSVVEAYVKGGKLATIQGNGLTFAKAAIGASKLGDKQIQPGALIRIQAANSESSNPFWKIVQVPEAEGALVSVDPKTGAVQALVGGFDFHKRSFNRAAQAWRQPGSTFKPFIYSAGLERGLTAATPINDAPIAIPGMGANGGVWRPKNSNNKYSGYIPMREALVYSKNMVTIRVLMAVGMPFAKEYIQRFGFNAKDHPASYSMALGAGSVTPMQMAQAYSVFANGGYRVAPYVIDRIYEGDHLRAQTQPLVAGATAKLVIDPRNAFIMTNIMQEITKRGTASRASVLGRSDIAGKTGTTNEGKDAWFTGYTPDLVSVVYVGYDKPRSLGRLGYGGLAALPIWIDYMRTALKGKPVVAPKVPEGLVRHGNEYFYQEYQRTNPSLALDNRSEGGPSGGGSAPKEGGGSEPDSEAPPTVAAPPANSEAIDSLF